MKSPHLKQGFTTVELLITLFVAAAFLATGFELYTAIIRNGASTKQMATASNLAYSALRQAAATNPPCSTTPSVTPSTPTGTSLPNPSMTTTISAPHGCPWTNNVMEVTVSITYGSPSNPQEVSHALFVQR